LYICSRTATCKHTQMSETHTGKKKKSNILLIIGVLLLILIVVKIISNSKKGHSESTKPIAQAVQTECIIAKDTLISFTFKAVGNIRANEAVELVSELSLRLVSIHFEEGSHVNRGDLLFQLDDAELQASIKKVKAKLDFAVETEKRIESLLNSGGTSKQVFDEAVCERKVLESEVESLNVLIGKTKILAPFSGVIGIRNVSEGAYLTSGKVLTTLEDLSRLKIDYSISQTYANLIRKGGRVNFRVDGNPASYTAVIEAINPSINQNSGNLKILAIIENSDKVLKAGITVSLTLVSKSAISAVYVPTQALVPTPGGYHMFVAKNGKAGYRPVTTGIRSETMVEIIKGIVPGDTVLVSGFMKLRPGSKLEIIKVR
jgi:membrane fusion protein (multidrug efflux system)